MSGSCDTTLMMWNYKTGEYLHSLKGHIDEVNSVIYIPKTKFIASGGKDKTIIIWNYETRERVKTLEGHIDSIKSITYIPNT